ncbi:unnamed protein product [Urochloa humidicola]
MASDDEVDGPSLNEELRMAGLRGDDESDLEADREELFDSFAAPIKVDAGDGAAGSAAAGAGDGAAGAADAGAGDGAATSE